MVHVAFVIGDVGISIDVVCDVVWDVVWDVIWDVVCDDNIIEHVDYDS